MNVDQVLPAFEWLDREWDGDRQWSDLRDGFVQQLTAVGVAEYDPFARWLLDTVDSLSAGEARATLLGEYTSPDAHVPELLHRYEQVHGAGADGAADAGADGGADGGSGVEDHWDAERGHWWRWDAATQGWAVSDREPPEGHTAAQVEPQDPATEASDVTAGVVDDIVGPALEQLAAQVPEIAAMPADELSRLLAETVAERLAAAAG